MKIIYRKNKHNPCHCDLCIQSFYKLPCGGCGHHNSFWATVIESKYWKAWRKYQDKKGWEWDFTENEELGIISPGHFEEFMKWITKNYREV